MKILIIDMTEEQARRTMEEMTAGCPDCSISQRTGNSIKFTNGDIIVSTAGTPSIKGMKCDKAYVSLRASNEFIDRVVKPMLMYSWLPRDEQIVRT